MKVMLAGLLLPCALTARISQSAPPPIVLDDFETPAGWGPNPSDGVSLSIGSDAGADEHGRSMRLDFDFHGHGGYAVVRRAMWIALPENYEITFKVRGQASSNNLEFKLIDPSGDNVWWVNHRNFSFPDQWTTIRIEPRDLRFAWGPAGGGVMHYANAIEIGISPGSGGKGTVWIDDLVLAPREPDRPYDLTPRATASSAATGHRAEAVLDSDTGSEWRSAPGASTAWIELDFLRRRAFSGIVLDWGRTGYASSYTVNLSNDGRRWTTAYRARDGDGGRDYIPLPESEARYLRLALTSRREGRSYALRAIDVKPQVWAATPNAFFAAIATDAPPGLYPRYFRGEQAFWTITGVSGDGRTSLLSENGAVEPLAGGFTVEPFLATTSGLLTWHDVTRRQWLERGSLPIPSVEWTRDSLGLTVTALATGSPKASILLLRYRAENRGVKPIRATLYLAVRPFQVNPPWQFLNFPGGVAPIHALAYDGSVVRIDDTLRVVPLTPAASFGATTFDRGDIATRLHAGSTPTQARVRDPHGYASGALAYPLSLAPGAAREIYLLVPLYRSSPLPGPFSSQTAARAWVDQQFAAAVRNWTGRLDRVDIRLPPAAAAVAASIKANLGYALVSREGAALEPGTRAYRRAWIRDGALISAALLRLGHADAVRDFIEWFAPYQYPDGRIPCCVDKHGADPVPENDSGGEFIYLIMEYYRYTGDRALLEQMWPRVTKAVAYLDSLRHERMTPEYASGAQRVFYGLLPQSISHEGYSAKPMHSYWDDFFALEGFKDATEIARVLGLSDDAARFAAIRDEFRRDLTASIALSMQQHRIDFIPGSADLGDFDATSTTIAIAPVAETAALPAAALERTFQRYYERYQARRAGTLPEDAYTPYELRAVGIMVHLGRTGEANELLDFFMGDQRPAGWHHWAEVVHRDPLAPKYIGDMPHIWVGSDFLRSVLDFFAYVRDDGRALIVGAGIPESWVRTPPGVRVQRLRTPFGPLDLSMHAADSTELVARVGGHLQVPPDGIVVRSPIGRPIRRATIDGQPIELTSPGEIVVRRIPADVRIAY